MPVTPTYPGVYVEEIPSGVRSIAGVATSVAAFIGYFSRGPVDTAVRVLSFGDFEREFGGLNRHSEASYAVQQFFRNGGGEAWIVRVPGGGDFGPATGELLDGADTASFTVTTGRRVRGSTKGDAGSWGNSVRLIVDHDTADPAEQFNLTVQELVTENGRVRVLRSETFRNLVNEEGAGNDAVEVVNEGSKMVQLTRGASTERPAPTPLDPETGEPIADPLTGGSDGDLPADLPTATELLGDRDTKTGLYALEEVDLFNLRVIPSAADLAEEAMQSVYGDAVTYCEERLAMLLVDIPAATDTLTDMEAWMSANGGLRHQNAAVYFPRPRIADPLNQFRLRSVGTGGTLAGLYARTDGNRGVWKAPAGIEATLRGVQELDAVLSDPENGVLNPIGVNVLRIFPNTGPVAWGARTLRGANSLASEWKYVPVRRTALFLEESLYRGLQWVVFEPNDEPLWAQIRLNVGSFMQGLFRQGAFQGTSPREAYLVKCDSETTTQADVDQGIVNVIVGFAPLKPAEFVILKIQQLAGQSES